MDPGLLPTVRPLANVVDSVFTPFLPTGVANPLLNGATALRAARLRSPWVRFRANRRDAMEVLCKGILRLFLGCLNHGIPGSKVVSADLSKLISPANQRPVDGFGKRDMSPGAASSARRHQVSRTSYISTTERRISIHNGFNFAASHTSADLFCTCFAAQLFDKAYLQSPRYQQDSTLRFLETKCSVRFCCGASARLNESSCVPCKRPKSHSSCSAS